MQTTNTNMINKTFFDDFQKVLNEETRHGWIITHVDHTEKVGWWAVLSRPVGVRVVDGLALPPLQKKPPPATPRMIDKPFKWFWQKEKAC